MHGDRNYDAVYAPDVHQLLQLLESNAGHCDMRFHARQVHLFFKHRIYLPMRRAGKRVAMWRSRSIYEHLMYHDIEPRLMLNREIRFLRTNTDQLKNMLYDRDPETGAITTNFKNQKLLCEQIKLMTGLYKQDPRHLNFYDDAALYDPGARTKQAMEGTMGTYRVTQRQVSTVYERRRR